MTYDEWRNAFAATYTTGEYVHCKFGQAFFYAVYAESATLGGALTTFRNDPYYAETQQDIAPDVHEFLRRNWNMTR